MRLPVQRFIRVVRLTAALVASTALAACDGDGPAAGPEPVRIVIAALFQETYAGDVITLSARIVDRNGRLVTGAPVTWSVDNPARGEISQDRLLLLAPGSLVITARSGALSETQALTVRALRVQAVTVAGGTVVALRRGDIVPLGVRIQGEGGRDVSGRAYSLSSDDPSIALIDASGRVRAVSPGVTTVRAIVDGVGGAARVEVSQEDVTLSLTRLGTTRLPARLESYVDDSSGSAREYEVWIEGGTLSMTTVPQPRYAVSVRFATYEVDVVHGTRTLQFVSATTVRDRGIVQYDPRGDLLLTSDDVFPLSHRSSAVSGGFHLQFREPGADSVLELFYRREPE